MDFVLGSCRIVGVIKMYNEPPRHSRPVETRAYGPLYVQVGGTLVPGRISHAAFKTGRPIIRVGMLAGAASVAGLYNEHPVSQDLQTQIRVLVGRSC